MTRLARVPDDTVLYPGHLYSPEPSATMGDTRAHNYVFRLTTPEQWMTMFGAENRRPSDPASRCRPRPRPTMSGHERTRAPPTEPSSSSVPRWPACGPPRRYATRATPGPVVVVGEEIHAPYDRPPLSKQLLSGKWEVERIHHHAPDALDALGFEFRLGRRATALDTEARTVACNDGTELCLRRAGRRHRAATRSPPGTDGMPGVWMLRTLDDCLGIKAGLAAGRRWAPGGGHRRRVHRLRGGGHLPRPRVPRSRCSRRYHTPLARVLGDEMGRACADLHRGQRHGPCGPHVTVDQLEPDPRGPDPVVVCLDDGTRLPARCGGGGHRGRARPSTGWPAPGSPSRTAWSVTARCSPPTGWWPPATWPTGGARHGLGRPVSSTGPTPPRGARPPPATSWPGRRPPWPTTPSRSSGPTSTTTKIQMIGLPGPDDEVVVVERLGRRGEAGRPLPRGRPAGRGAGLQPAGQAHGLPPAAGRRRLVRRGTGPRRG